MFFGCVCVYLFLSKNGLLKIEENDLPTKEILPNTKNNIQKKSQTWILSPFPSQKKFPWFLRYLFFFSSFPASSIPSSKIQNISLPFCLCKDHWWSAQKKKKKFLSQNHVFFGIFLSPSLFVLPVKQTKEKKIQIENRFGTELFFPPSDVTHLSFTQNILMSFFNKLHHFSLCDCVVFFFPLFLVCCYYSKNVNTFLRF